MTKTVSENSNKNAQKVSFEQSPGGVNTLFDHARRFPKAHPDKSKNESLSVALQGLGQCVTSVIFIGMVLIRAPFRIAGMLIYQSDYDREHPNNPNNKKTNNQAYLKFANNVDSILGFTSKYNETKEFASQAERNAYVAKTRPDLAYTRPEKDTSKNIVNYIQATPRTSNRYVNVLNRYAIVPLASAAFEMLYWPARLYQGHIKTKEDRIAAEQERLAAERVRRVNAMAAAEEVERQRKAALPRMVYSEFNGEFFYEEIWFNPRQQLQLLQDIQSDKAKPLAHYGKLGRVRWDHNGDGSFFYDKDSQIINTKGTPHKLMIVSVNDSDWSVHETTVPKCLAYRRDSRLDRGTCVAHGYAPFTLEGLFQPASKYGLDYRGSYNYYFDQQTERNRQKQEDNRKSLELRKQQSETSQNTTMPVTGKAPQPKNTYKPKPDTYVNGKPQPLPGFNDHRTDWQGNRLHNW